jgi:FtsP/CotA-like multicopper oxidase with cupredoxin domain
MTHIEDLALAPHQRLHLIEVDGRTFMVHAGKGHAASFIAVDGEPLAEMVTAPAETVAATKAKSKNRAAAKDSVGNAGKGAAKPARPAKGFAAAIAAARRNNPSVEFGK